MSGYGGLKIALNVKYMASSRTRTMIRITKFNKPQIVSKMPDTAICYIHCQAQLIMNKKLLKRIDEIFEQKLQEKTGWGRNDVLKIYREAVNEAIIEMLDT